MLHNLVIYHYLTSPQELSLWPIVNRSPTDYGIAWIVIPTSPRRRCSAGWPSSTRATCWLAPGKSSSFLRLGEQQANEAVQSPGVDFFNITGKPMRGWVMVDEAEIEDDVGLKQWISQAFEFVSTLRRK